jgi:hypothetical protein
MSRIALAVLLAVVLVAAGCGSKSKTTSTSDWANGLCTAITTWKTSITTAANSLKAGNLTQQSVQSAADDAKTATDTLASDLKKLGKPDTEAGAQAKQDVDDLSTQIQDGVQTIQDTLNSASGLAGILSAVPTVTSSLQTMGNEISSTFTSLKQLDAKGELQTAFKQAPACKPYIS